MNVTDQTDAGCQLCIDFMAPVGIHPVLGEVYRVCPACAICAGCDNTALYPVRNVHYFAGVLEELGFDVELCRSCCGVTAIYRRV